MPRKNPVQAERQFRPSACVVCKEAAVGYNYDAPTCATCRSFFRRAVLKKLASTKCVRKGTCAESEFRGMCRPCRYERCIKGGMNPLHVTSAGNKPGSVSQTSSQDDEPPSLGNETTGSCSHVAASSDKASVECQTEDVTERMKPSCDPGPSNDKGKEMSIVWNPNRIESQLEKLMQNLLMIETAHHKLRNSKYTPRVKPGLSIDDFAFGSSKLGAHFEPMLSQAHEPISVQLMPVEVVINNRIVLDCTNFDYNVKKMWQFQDVAYMIEFMKAFSFYHQLDDCSKRALAGSALIGSNFTSAFFSYSQHSDRTCYPDGSVMTWAGELQDQSPDTTRFHTGLIAAIREAQLDRREYTLLKMIIVCNPLLDGLLPHDATVLQQEKERCTRALFSYVLARRGTTEGPAFFAKILAILDVATRLTAWQKSTHILVMAMGLYVNITPFAETFFHSQ